MIDRAGITEVGKGLYHGRMDRQGDKTILCFVSTRNVKRVRKCMELQKEQRVFSPAHSSLHKFCCLLLAVRLRKHFLSYAFFICFV